MVEYRTAEVDGRDPDSSGHVASVNVGGIRTVRFRDGLVSTAIWKSPVAGAVRLRGVNFEGDGQADRSVHGGPDKAVYAYAREDLTWWAAELGQPVEPGTFGENLTTEGIDVTGSVVGERWAIGSVLLEVSQPRIPCFKLGIRMGDPTFPPRFAAAGRPGAYLRVITAGRIAARERIQVVARPEHGVTVGSIERAYHSDRSLLPQFFEAPELPEPWREWARRMLQARTA